MRPGGESRPLHVLVVGGGGREHALAWACSRSPEVGRVTCAPGNAGTLRVAGNRPVSATDPEALARLAREEAVDLALLGPDGSIAAGVADALREAGVDCFGPDREAGRLETSKAFAKELMRDLGVATPDFRVFDDAEAADQWLRRRPGPSVVKADGLALGKGAFVCDDTGEALAVVDRLLRGRELGEAGARLVIEDRLEGEEASFFALCDGESALMLPPARDYKRALEGERGANTGGMGSLCPPPGRDWGRLNQRVLREVVEPVLAEMRRRGHPYRGCLYVGAMLVGQEVLVLEFNARFGDPETEVQLPLLPDLLPLLRGAARGELRGDAPEPLAPACVGVVAVRRPYPDPVQPGGLLEGLEEAEENGCLIFQMGTRPLPGGGVEVSGGRVLICAAVAPDLAEGRRLAYQGLSRVHFPGMRYREDIGA